jgi:hypothetical protein
MPRSPKGVVVRTLPDWNYTNLYYGRVFAPGISNLVLDQWLGITNTAGAGQSLVLWHVEFSQAFKASNVAYPTPIVAAWNYNFTAQGGGGQAGGSLSAPGTLSPVTLFSGSSGNTPVPSQANFWNAANSATTGEYHWPHEYPYAIIPPNWGIAFFLIATTTPQQYNAGLNAYFVYELVASPL